MNEQHDSRSILGAARGFGRGPVEFADQIAKQHASQPEVQEEFDRNAMLLEQLEKALAALHERLGPVLMNGGAVSSNAQGVAPTQQRHSPLANMIQARNDRLEQFISHASHLRSDLAI